jgi:hypothetical protein
MVGISERSRRQKPGFYELTHCLPKISKKPGFLGLKWLVFPSDRAGKNRVFTNLLIACLKSQKNPVSWD